MTPSQLRKKVIVDRTEWILQMLSGIKALPLNSLEQFEADLRNPASAESFLRRALEALLDLGRHILAKGFGAVSVEYKKVADDLREAGVIDAGTADNFRLMAGYRNRLVHFYDEISRAELFEICSTGTQDIETALEALLAWVRDNPDRIDEQL